MATEYTEYAGYADGELAWSVRLLARLLPASDRQSVIGDLLEAAEDRGLSGGRRTAWLGGECASIAAGLSVQRLRGRFVLFPMAEVVSGLALDGRGALRDGAALTLLRLLIFAGSIATLVFGVELLVASLMSAAGV